jgi:hypothetical protein
LSFSFTVDDIVNNVLAEYADEDAIEEERLLEKQAKTKEGEQPKKKGRPAGAKNKPKTSTPVAPSHQNVTILYNASPAVAM